MKQTTRQLLQKKYKEILDHWKDLMTNEDLRHECEKLQHGLPAYEELKIHNACLLELTRELKEEKEKCDKQLGEINLLNDKLQKTNSYLEEFTYTVSHDLKTPLTSLNVALELLEDATDRQSKISYIEIISRAAKRLEQTVQGLVEILDVQTKTQNLAKTINLQKFFKDIKEEFAPAVAANDVSITTDFLITSINYLQPYLTSIFTNLIGNSIKYRRPGEPLNILVSTRRKNGMVQLTFTDSGEGIDMKKYGKKLFTPFTRFNTQQEGKGIGLFIIKKMIEKNGGRIEVESEPGKGTSFIIYLKEYGVQ